MTTVPAPGVVDWDFPRNPASVELMVRYAAEHGLDRSVLVQAAGPAVVLDDPGAQIDARVELAVIRKLLDALGSAPGLGVDVGRRYRVTTFGIFGFACISSPTLRDAMGLALRYLELSFTFSIPLVEVQGEEIVATIRDERIPSDVRRFLVERDVTAMLCMIGDLVGAEIPLTQLDFAFPEPEEAQLAQYSRAFGRQPRFGQVKTVFAFSARHLDRELPQANEQTLALCLAQCRDLVARRRSRTGISQEVRERLIRLGGAPAGLDEVARELNMSERTLRRRLAEDGTSYRTLLDEVRAALAEELLAGTPLSVSDVAVRLGYAEASTFIHAFKRWKGKTPSAFQRERRWPSR